MLPSSFRVLHDAAATGSPLPEGGDSGGVDGAAVAPEIVARTVVANYGACRYDKERLAALQQITRRLAPSGDN